MNNTGPLSPVNGVGKSGTTTSCGETQKLRSLFSDDDDDDDEDRVMTTIDEAVFALIRSPLTDNESEWSTPLIGSRRPRVPHDSIDDADDNNFVAEDGQRRPDDSSVDRALTDMVPGTLPAIQKRAKDEVDVAAAGIPLEVRRFQCTKSTLALKEATKNDATPQSPKLVDYLVSMTKSSDGLCTEKEMCRWLVAQMCDRLQTGQIWVMAKTFALLSALQWRGSISFVAAVHDYGRSLFQASHIEKLIRETEQQNLAGDRLPCLLQPIASASAGQKSACGKVKSHSGCVFEMMKRKTSGDSCRAKRGADGRVGTEDVPEGDLNFLITNVAYLESLCEYRMRHPTLDLVHGEILMADISDAAAQADPAVAATLRKTYSPTAWKELLDDTLELMKAIASTDPQVPICSLGRVAANTRLRESVLLYQVACRALVRLLHSVLTVSHTFIASIQAGLNICSNLAPADGSAKPPSPTETSTASNFLGVSFDPNALDYSLTPDVVHGFTHDYYYAIYQFNRTVNMLRAYCEAAEHVDKDTSKRALAAFKVLPEACILELKSSFHHIDHPLCSNTIGRLFSAARHAAQTRKASSGDSTSCGSDHSPTSPVLSPLSDEEVRQSMLAVYTFHLQHKSLQDQMWRHQVNAVCGLFDEKESNVLHQIFTAGLEGLRNQWNEFTNNGAAAAEKALMDSSNLSAKNAESNGLGLSNSDNAVSGDRSPDHHGSDTSSVTKSSTYILRSLPSGVRVRASSGTKTDVITLERSGSLESSTESAIDALLQEDDVVVICNEECSCNDKLKLVDRFQVLRDVPMGEGSYGKVYRAWDEVVGCYLAAKELPLDASKAHNVAVREVLQEYTVLTELSHPNIVRVVAFMVLRLTARIYMEWMPSGSLQDVLRHHPRGMLRESVVRRYARDVLSGLAFLHSRGVIHRDVKPGNMLLSSDGTVKLTDFGTSLVLSGNHRTLESSSVTGTAAYMAPECVQGTYSSASDIWSFGCSVVHLVSGTVPWCSPTTGSTWEPIALLFKIGNLDDTTHLERPHDALKAAAKDTEAALDGDSFGSTTPAAAVDVDAADATEETSKSTKGVSAELLDMLDAIFVVDRRKRPSATELLQYPFFAVN